MTVLLRLLGLVVGIIAGAIVAPIAVYVLLMIVGVVQHYCWGPGVDDACLVSTLAHLYIFMFVSWIPGAIVGFIIAARWGRARQVVG